MSNEYQVNIGLRQGSALSPLVFILVMELISRKIRKTDALTTIMYADDLTSDRCRASGRIARRTGGVEHRQDRSDVG